MKAMVPIFGFIIVAVCMVILYNGLTAFNTKSVPSAEVWKQTQLIVSDTLVSPKTAEYPKLGDRGVDVENRKDNTYYVKGYVDSKNRVGVPVRTRFETVIKCAGANKWVVVLWDTEEAKAIRQATEQLTNTINQLGTPPSPTTADAERLQREADADAARVQRQLELQQKQIQQQAPVEQPVQAAPTSNWGGSQ